MCEIDKSSMAIISFPVLLICLLLPDFLLGIFGPEFICGKQILIILCVGQFINVSTGSVGQILAMTNREKLLRISVLSGTVLNLLLNITLVPLILEWKELLLQQPFPGQ